MNDTDIREIFYEYVIDILKETITEQQINQIHSRQMAFNQLLRYQYNIACERVDKLYHNNDITLDDYNWLIFKLTCWIDDYISIKDGILENEKKVHNADWEKYFIK